MHRQERGGTAAGRQSGQLGLLLDPFSAHPLPIRATAALPEQEQAGAILAASSQMG